jgi:hypothetical protein
MLASNRQRVVCLVVGDDYEGAENARLIAASPELLAACKAALETIRTADDFNDVEAVVCLILRAAIAKARSGKRPKHVWKRK